MTLRSTFLPASLGVLIACSSIGFAQNQTPSDGTQANKRDEAAYITPVAFPDHDLELYDVTTGEKVDLGRVDIAVRSVKDKEANLREVSRKFKDPQNGEERVITSLILFPDKEGHFSLHEDTKLYVHQQNQDGSISIKEQSLQNLAIRPVDQLKRQDADFIHIMPDIQYRKNKSLSGAMIPVDADRIFLGEREGKPVVSTTPSFVVQYDNREDFAKLNPNVRAMLVASADNRNPDARQVEQITRHIVSQHNVPADQILNGYWTGASTIRVRRSAENKPESGPNPPSK